MRELLPTSLTRLGILGGTFDPIHFGHLAIAEEARQRYALEAVLLIPAALPPHKPCGQANAEQRCLMAELATAEHPNFFVSRMEIERDGPSYTVDTLRQLHNHLPGVELFFLIGADSALEFHGWREPDMILQLARVIAAARPGFPLDRLQQSYTEGRRMELMPAPGLEISSTELRARVRAGMSLRYLAPDPVAAYIRKMGLYRES